MTLQFSILQVLAKKESKLALCNFPYKVYVSSKDKLTHRVAFGLKWILNEIRKWNDKLNSCFHYLFDFTGFKCFLGNKVNA